MRTRRHPLEAIGWASGTGLLLATGGIHLDLYLTGYRSIPTIGWLFLLQVVVSFALAGAIGILRQRLLAALGALFALGTLGGYLLSVLVGLFGFKEVRTTAGIAAGAVEVVGVAVLAALAINTGVVVNPEPGRRRAHAPGRLAGHASSVAGMSLALVAVVSLVAAGVFGAAVASARTQQTGSGAAGDSRAAVGVELMTRRVDGALVLTNSAGFTLYWFARDSPAASRCYGSCAAYWPPVLGRPRSGSGVTGRFGTIERTGGQLQATFDGHPLYTYVGDSAPGEAHGNGVYLNGGRWHEVKVPGG
jgi:predicted lipoprotein with Yx(FWY)xxD motif